MLSPGTPAADRLFYFAEPEIDLRPAPEVVVKQGASFLVPNEEYPADAISILEKAVPGVYVSVGTERGFIGAALTQAVTHLLLVDRDPRVVLFNRINIALLTVAESQADYLNLRLSSNRQLWLERAESPGLSHQFKNLLSDPNCFAWWVSEVRDQEKFSLLHGSPVNTDEDPEFGRANYLHDQALFSRISEIAKAGRIDAQTRDFRDKDDMLQLRAQIEQAGHKVSVLDLSNAWWHNYIGTQLRTSLEILLPTLEQNGLLLITSLWSNGQNSSRSSDPRFWAYVAFSREHILSWNNIGAFDESLSRFRYIWPRDQGRIISEDVDEKTKTRFTEKKVGWFKSLFRWALSI